jgi:cobalt-zinc-cadmium efflux system outer membrane protein
MSARTFASVALALATVGTFGCASTSIASDVSRVKDLTHVERLARVEDADVDPAASAEARRLLEKPLDADAAVRVALLDNRELRAELREMGIARGQLIQAGLLPNPTFEAELLPERSTRYELRLEYDLTDALLAPGHAAAEEPGLVAATLRAAGAVIELGYRVRVAYYALQAAEQRLAIGQKMLDAHAAGRDAAQAMFAAGNVSELDLATRVAEYERARILVAELELDAASRREAVQRLLGTHGVDTEWKVAGNLPQVPEAPNVPRDLERRILKASLDLGEMRFRLERLARRAGMTRTEGWLPDVAVDVHALAADRDAPVGSPDHKVRFGAGVSVGVPLFDRRQGDVLVLESEFDALLERFYGASIDLRSAAREARNRVLSAHARARQYQEVIVPAERRVTEQTLLQYNAMQLGIYELLAAHRAELQGRLAQVDALRDYWSSVAELDALAAGKRVGAAPRTASAVSSETSAPAAGGH